MSTHVHVPIGRDARTGDLVTKSLPTVCGHSLVTGSTGSGKTGFLAAMLLWLLTNLRGVRAIVNDEKGELVSEIVTSFLPALADRYPHLGPERIVVVRPFSTYGVRLNLLAPIRGLDADVQVHVVAHLIANILDDGVGVRGKRILLGCGRGVRAVPGGNLALLRRLLTDEHLRHQVAAHVADPLHRQYLAGELAAEPRQSIAAVAARLDWILALRPVRAALTANGCLAPEDFTAGVFLASTGDAPMGFEPLGSVIGGFLRVLQQSAILTRTIAADTPQVFVCDDEWQRTLSYLPGAADHFERALSQYRFKRATCILASQNASAQVRDPHLLESLATNIAMEIAFRPSADAVRRALPLMALTGTRINPMRPDEYLDTAAERSAIVEELTALPPRHALVTDFIGGTAHVIKTLDVPFAEARRRAAGLPCARRDAFARGRLGVPIADLIAEAEALPEQQHLGMGTRATRLPSPMPLPTARLPRRPRLVLP